MAAPSGQALFNIFADEAKWDLGALSYEQWLDFLFQHPEADDDWYWREEWEYRISDNSILLQYLIEMVSNPTVLAERYSDAQLERGFWFLMGPAGFSDIVWDEALPQEERINYVRLNANLFRQLFATHPLDTGVFMWWDLFESGYSPDTQPVNADDAAIQEAILWTLGDILGMEEPHCVGSALHGLNHLHHPRVPEFIDYFLATKQELDEEGRQYALACRTGTSL